MQTPPRGRRLAGPVSSIPSTKISGTSRKKVRENVVVGKYAEIQAFVFQVGSESTLKYVMYMVDNGGRV